MVQTVSSGGLESLFPPPHPPCLTWKPTIFSVFWGVSIAVNSSIELDGDLEADMIRRTIRAEMVPEFDKEIQSNEGRLRFQNWLFNLADFERDQCITSEELALILKAAQRDGVFLGNLLYDGVCLGWTHILPPRPQRTSLYRFTRCPLLFSFL